MSDRFPRPYINSVPREGGDKSLMEYVDFQHMGIGARPSGMPQGGVPGPKSLEHVGGSASSGRGGSKSRK